MALFTDSAIVTIDDLLTFEVSLVQVTSSHGINVEGKIGLAMSAISDRLMLWLLNCGSSDLQWMNRRSLGLTTIVVTPVLTRWICLESLVRIYAEAYNAQLNTRYRGKLEEYQTEAERTANLYFQTGVGIVSNPLPRPAMPLISVQAGNVPAQSIFISTAWADSAGRESALSPQNAILLNDNSSIAIAMAEGALGAPKAAVSWNVYGGTETTTLSKQNAGPLEIGSTWELPVSGLLIGSPFNGGQAPEYQIMLSRQIRRG
jgi:hypothetical protein